MTVEPTDPPAYDPSRTDPEPQRYDPATAPGPFERGTDGPKVVLAGVDGTVTSMRAVAYAAGLARRQGSRLVVVFVAAPPVLASLTPGVGGQVQDALEELGAELRTEIGSVVEELGVPLTFLGRRGDPYAELRTVADELRADMVVVGASTQAGHRLVGSIAARLVKSGHWPVVVVP
ncbi:nucleotide-binding universal stress UspA family protein [Micromonospora pisi]|uniref:Nucleotide-binding universal stress UspA family protein n=1 Tax=Micromonospora pisi TaxID=589240 RepID=A0A495JNY5_9ACTN|nr:universal stress protein [Micromonospora pisi]RKR90717.1 nucleotide-binding universal stress UspA family protein [Micromonospora pisi]